jgi:hypothetical protein
MSSAFPLMKLDRDHILLADKCSMMWSGTKDGTEYSFQMQFSDCDNCGQGPQTVMKMAGKGLSFCSSCTTRFFQQTVFTNKDFLTFLEGKLEEKDAEVNKARQEIQKEKKKLLKEKTKKLEKQKAACKRKRNESNKEFKRRKLETQEKLKACKEAMKELECNSDSDSDSSSDSDSDSDSSSSSESDNDD